jgi:hypothetical protein
MAQGLKILMELLRIQRVLGLDQLEMSYGRGYQDLRGPPTGSERQKP